MTDMEKLRELVKEWRNTLILDYRDPTSKVECRAVKKCAVDLEKLLDSIEGEEVSKVLLRDNIG